MPRRIGLRWWIIALVMVGTIVNYLTRSSLAVAAPALLADLHIDERHYSWINGTFQAGLMMQPLVGYLLDLIGLRVGIALFATGWALLTAAHGLAGNWQGLAALRGALGFAEGTSHTGGLKIVSEWFPAKERGIAGGIYNLGASAGAALAAPLVAGAILLWSWRAAFFVCGALALAWVGLWLLFYAPPERHRLISPAEKAKIVEGREAHVRAEGTRPPVLAILRQRNFWGIALPRFLADPTWGTLTIWMPLYLTRVRGFDLAHIALFAFLPFVAADLGCMTGPALTLWFQRRGLKLIDARRAAFTCGAVLMTGTIFIGWVDSAAVAIALLCLAGFAHQILSVTVITMATDLFRQNEVGTVAGLAGLLGNGGVLLSTLAIGAMVAAIGYAPFFALWGLLDVAGAIILWTFVRAPVSEAT
ncbi:MAG TPA: MFS transporter [Allosphingosinicella sp.]|nr:MFS transporter [Allosphingosinicella sp.]